MKWLEVIMVRSAGSNAKILAKTLQELMADVARSAGNDDIRVFHRENIETDICSVSVISFFRLAFFYQINFWKQHKYKKQGR